MSIQYIRAAAAIVVIVWHTGWARTVLGQSGVDLFFVVSGFVMMLVSANDHSPGRFGVARLARIVPLYWAVTIFVAVIDRSSARKLAASLFFWPDGGYPVVIQGWSLNLEMSYYVLFAFTLLAPPRWRLQVLAIEMIAVCLVLPIMLPVSAPLTAWSSPLAFEFLAGAVLHALWRRGYVPVGGAAWLLGAAALAVLASTHLLGGGPEGWTRAVIWGGPALAIVTAGLGIEAAGQLPRSRLMEVLGGASYAIYVTHLAALNFVSGPLHSLWAPMAVSLAVIWTCVIGWAVHLVFELPAHRFTTTLLKHLWPKPQSTPA